MSLICRLQHPRLMEQITGSNRQKILQLHRHNKRAARQILEFLIHHLGTFQFLLSQLVQNQQNFSHCFFFSWFVDIEFIVHIIFLGLNLANYPQLILWQFSFKLDCNIHLILQLKVEAELGKVSISPPLFLFPFVMFPDQLKFILSVMFVPLLKALCSYKMIQVRTCFRSLFSFSLFIYLVSIGV